MKTRKVVLLIGAGATVADVVTRSIKRRPPLDKKFFSAARNYRETSRINSYMKESYDIDILAPTHDSLELIMARLYTDVFDPNLGTKAADIFRDLVYLFNRRLSDTTNDIVPTQQRFLYRIITHYFNRGIKPSDITIITFNQDLQIEKIVHKIEKTECWRSLGKIFRFPNCYRLDIRAEFVTSPSESSKNLFPSESSSHPQGIQILKLHGSLNWYSTHRSSRVPPKAMFKPDRQIWITRRQNIDPTMKLTREHRAQHTLPVIVPPVTHKSSILHNRIKKIWGLAGDSLMKADEVTVFGYSCSAFDFESCNLIQRFWKRNRKCAKISIIDPDSSVLKHYVDLIKPESVFYYPTARYFLQEA